MVRNYIISKDKVGYVTYITYKPSIEHILKNCKLRFKM
jgi:hypothetical protein